MQINSGHISAYVYFAHIVDDFYKIGWSINPKTRVHKFGLGAKDIVHTIGTSDPLWAETVIHTAIESNRVPIGEIPEKVLERTKITSHEIYRLSDSELAEIKELSQLHRP